MTKKEISAILSRASKEEVEAIAEPWKETEQIEIIKQPQKTLVMVKVRESVGQSLFYLGEVLATECMVTVNGMKGFSVMAGDDFDKSLSAAIVDGLLNNKDEDSKREKVMQDIVKLEKKQQAGRARMNAEILKSKVNFNVMGES